MTTSRDHSKALWRESSDSGAVLGAVPIYFIADGSDVIPSLTGPERFVFYDVEGDGSYHLLDLTPVYIVADGSDYAVNQVGPAVAIFADDGAGGIEFTTDLTRTPVADLFYDAGGDLWLVPRTTDRLDAVQLGGGIQLY
jgi:hypothetical protein